MKRLHLFTFEISFRNLKILAQNFWMWLWHPYSDGITGLLFTSMVLILLFFYSPDTANAADKAGESNSIVWFFFFFLLLMSGKTR